jgi:hypothetical protein
VAKAAPKTHLIAPALNALLRDPKKVFEASYARIWEAIGCW